MNMGQIGELSRGEQWERLEQQCKEIQTLELQTKKKKAKTIAELFNELLANLEDATCYLQQLNALFPEDDESCDNLFWSQLYETTKPLKYLLADLEGVEKHMPKEVEA